MKKKTDMLSIAKQEIESDPILKRLTYQEILTLDVTEKVLELMEKQKISRKEMAKKLSFSPKFFDDIISGQFNIPLRMVSDIFLILGHQVTIQVNKDKGL